MNEQLGSDSTNSLKDGVEYLIAWSTKTEFKGDEIHVYGNPAGLRSLANKLLEMADFDQSTGGFPDNDSEHHHYKIGCNTENPEQHPMLTIGRVDSKQDSKQLRDCFPALDPENSGVSIR